MTLEHRLTVIEQAVNNGFNSLDIRAAKIEAHLATQNGRLAKVEQWQWKAVGALAILGPGIFFVLNRMFPA